jgi:hypothetical protein
MQLIALTSAAALIATVSASPSPATNAQAFNLNASTVDTLPKVRIFNRCPYKVYLWSVLTGLACPSGDGAVLETGDFYQENFRPAVGGVGTSIKLSKTQSCDPDRLLQLEYYIETTKPGYNYNYLDVSYVNAATTKDCPTSSEGFYLKSGNEDGKFASNGANTICPILSCNDWASCAKVAYVNWDDIQTKSCDPNANLDFYMCGGEAPGVEAPKPDPVPSSSPAKQLPPVVPSSAPAKVNDVVAAAIVTPAPAAPAPDKPIHVKTEIVYVTEIAYVNAKKRHEHGHRHQHFHA